MASGPGLVPVIFGAAAGGMVVVACREVFLASPAALRWLESSLSPLLRAGREGYMPTEQELRRLAVLGSVAVLLGVFVIVGPGPLGLIAVAGPAGVSTVIARKRSRYRRAVEKDLPAIATAVADALAGGRSVRSALGAAENSLNGAAAIEVSRLRADLELGAPTEEVLERFRSRIDTPGVDSFVTALVSRQLSGGDLAGLLRRYASVVAERERTTSEARSATAQARFTGLLVVAMPVGAGLFAELLRPGFTGALLSDRFASALLGAAFAIQVVGFLAISRIARAID